MSLEIGDMLHASVRLQEPIPESLPEIPLVYVADPTPYLVVPQIVPWSEYERLEFPDDLVRNNSPWGITQTDPEMKQVRGRPGWGRLMSALRAEQFVRRVLSLLGDDLDRYGCLVTAAKLNLTEFEESRDSKELKSLNGVPNPNDLFTRLDFQSKGMGQYREFVHLDWPRRIVGGLFFFSDAEEEGLEGGELAFYRDRAFANDRWCHDPELTTMITPRANTGIIFLNHNGAFHGPRAIRALRGRRRWLYFTISSRSDVWPHSARVA